MKISAEFKLTSAAPIKAFAEAAAALTDEARFDASPEEGLKVNMMDESHICMLHATLPVAWWESVDVPAPVSFNLCLEDFQKVAKRAGAGDHFTLQYDSDAERIACKFIGKNIRTHRLINIDIDADKIPPTADLDLDFTSTFTLPATFIEEAAKDAEIYQDTLSLAVSEQQVVIQAESEVGDMLYQIPAGNLGDDPTLKNQPEVKYSLGFIKNVLKAGALAADVEVAIGYNMPARFKFLLEKGAVLTYFLAPRVGEEEEDFEGD